MFGNKATQFHYVDFCSDLHMIPGCFNKLKNLRRLDISQSQVDKFLFLSLHYFASPTKMIQLEDFTSDK